MINQMTENQIRIYGFFMNINNARQVQVSGQIFYVESNYAYRGTVARNSDGEIRAISQSGYISNDLSVRKAIAIAFGLPTFRKN